MPVPKLLMLATVFFATSVISVVTGSTSLVTVPVMITCGMEPHTAVATNMFALIFLSAGGLTPLSRTANPARPQLLLAAILTIFGSLAGALLLTSVPVRSLQLVIAVAMIAVALFSCEERPGNSNA
jgi:uncharacterized protein